MAQGWSTSHMSSSHDKDPFDIITKSHVEDTVLEGLYVCLTIIPQARIGYEVIDSQRGAKRQVCYNHLISNKCEWNNCFIKNRQQILLDFADFAWLEQPEGNLMEAFSRVWYNGSYTIAAKPIKTLELHYSRIQFLINTDIPQVTLLKLSALK